MLNKRNNYEDIDSLRQKKEHILNTIEEIRKNKSHIKIMQLEFKLFVVSLMLYIKCKKQGHTYIASDLKCIICGHRIHGKNQGYEFMDEEPEIDIALSFLSMQKDALLEENGDTSIILFDRNLSSEEQRIVALKDINKRICDIQGHVDIEPEGTCFTCGRVKGKD